jgi:hypothetical protein
MDDCTCLLILAQNQHELNGGVAILTVVEEVEGVSHAADAVQVEQHQVCCWILGRVANDYGNGAMTGLWLSGQFHLIKSIHHMVLNLFLRDLC